MEDGKGNLVCLYPVRESQDTFRPNVCLFSAVFVSLAKKIFIIWTFVIEIELGWLFLRLRYGQKHRCFHKSVCFGLRALWTDTFENEFILHAKTAFTRNEKLSFQNCSRKCIFS